MRFKPLTTLVSLSSCVVLFFNNASAQSNDCTLVSTAIEEASSIRGLKIKKAVPCSLQQKSEVEHYLRETLDKKVPPERIANEGKVYEMLGLVPVGYDYLNNLIKLYTEQLGGYYDTETDRYVMASWLPAAMQMPIAVHELTHALQDQHFDLEAMLDEKNDNSDTLLARSSLIEGDATAVMLDYARRIGHERPLAKEPSVSAFMMQNITGAMLTGSVSSAPPAIQAMIIFPYVSGLRFAHALLRKGSYEEVNRAFKNLPVSSEQILHPDLYLEKKKSFEVPTPPKTPEGMELDFQTALYRDRLGEFVISTLLASYVSPLQASAAASGWGGDQLWLFRTSSGKFVLIWRLLWDEDKDAKQFFDAMQQAYEKRFSQQAKTLAADTLEFTSTAVGEVLIKKTLKTVDISIF